MAETLFNMCDKETQRRETFLRKHGVHLPRVRDYMLPAARAGIAHALSCTWQDLIAGLNERPLPAEVRAREFDMSVRKLDMSEEVDEGASETQAAAASIGAGSLLLSAAPKWDEAPAGATQREACAQLNPPALTRLLFGAHSHGQRAGRATQTRERPASGTSCVTQGCAACLTTA